MAAAPGSSCILTIENELGAIAASGPLLLPIVRNRAATRQNRHLVARTVSPEYTGNLWIYVYIEVYFCAYL